MVPLDIHESTARFPKLREYVYDRKLISNVCRAQLERIAAETFRIPERG
jgi:hypothetical protein